MKKWEKYIKENSHFADGMLCNYEAMDLDEVYTACNMAENCNDDEHNELNKAYHLIRTLKNKIIYLHMESDEVYEEDTSEMIFDAEQFLNDNSYLNESEDNNE